MQKPIKLIGYYLVVLTLFASCRNAQGLSVAAENGDDLKGSERTGSGVNEDAWSSELVESKPEKTDFVSAEEEEDVPKETGRGVCETCECAEYIDSLNGNKGPCCNKAAAVWLKCYTGKEYELYSVKPRVTLPVNKISDEEYRMKAGEIVPLEKVRDCSKGGAKEFEYHEPSLRLTLSVIKTSDKEYRTKGGEIMPLDKIHGISRCGHKETEHIELADNESEVNTVGSWGKDLRGPLDDEIDTNREFE